MSVEKWGDLEAVQHENRMIKHLLSAEAIGSSERDWFRLGTAWEKDFVRIDSDGRAHLTEKGLAKLSDALSGDSGEPAELTRYRVVAQRTNDAHPGAASLTHYTYARSCEEAVAKVRQAHEKPGGVYGDQGLIASWRSAWTACRPTSPAVPRPLDRAGARPQHREDAHHHGLQGDDRHRLRSNPHHPH
ncbi:hypothetical protein [Streptomyces cavernae]|uniref:hypothetical protein n=1 Tax=Streptomyces cavernae TaxID=2259034 RepID=UPI000FEB65C5|nr:hypothetical protein [Streptomyces cavernae]